MRRLSTIVIFALLALLSWGQRVDYGARMSKAGLVDLSTLGPGITICLKYATTDNFTHKNMYGDFRCAYLIKPAAESLRKALKQLRAINPDYGFIGTVGQRYVAPPRRGGPHNYGVAIDISLTYKGHPMDMGTPFDTFTTDAHITNEPLLVKQGRISQQAMRNRQLLRKVLTDNGFMTYSREWWHFERYRVGYARKHFALLNF